MPTTTGTPGNAGEGTAERTSFVGRDADIIRVSGLLASERVVTIVGAGGAGKTRLAIRSVASAQTSWPDGVWFCDLATATDATGAAMSVAATLGVVDQPGRSATDALAAHLAAASTLLLLDNCEQGVDGVAAVVDAVVRAGPGVTVLATSREPLRVPGEVLHPVGALSLPPEGTPWVEVRGYEAPRLFAERAAAVAPGFGIDEHNADAVVEICRRLDGLPLAIELAAARVMVLTPAQIAAGLADRFRLLRAGTRASAPRQQTLEASVAWSYDLLSPEERILFARLSVFAGSFELAAARAVGEGGELAADAVFDVLARLVARSMVTAEPSGDVMRYRLLETLRAYGRDRLAASGDEHTTRDRHFSHVSAAVASALRAPTAATSDSDGFAVIDSLRDEVNAALAWALTVEPSRAVRLVVLLRPYWVRRGRYRDALRWAEACLGALPANDARTIGKVRVIASTFRHYLGDIQGAVDDAMDARDLAREVGDPRLEAQAAAALGWPQALLDPMAGAATLAGAPALAEAAGDYPSLIESLLAASSLAQLTEGVAAARLPAERGIAAASAAGDHVSVLMLSAGVGFGEILSGRVSDGVAHLEGTLAGLDRADFPYWAGFTRVSLTLGHVFLGDFAAAEQRCDEAAAAADRIANPLLALYAHLYRCLCRLAGGDSDGISTAAADVSRAAAVVGGWQGAAAAAFAAAAHGRALLDADPARAGELVADAARVVAGINQPMAAAGIGVVAAVAALTDGDYDTASLRGLDALSMLANAGLDAFAPEALDVLGAAAAVAGETSRADRLAAAAAGQRASMGTRPIGLGTSPDQAAIERADTLAGLSLAEVMAWLRPASGIRKRPATGWDSLTPAERSVVDLVVEGYTNAEVAARLFVSPRTVSTHLTHVFDKLGVTSRTELATITARRNPSAR